MSTIAKRVAMLGAATALAATVGTAQAQTGGEGFGDFVWSDLNANGIQDGGEPGLAGVSVSLFRNGSVIATTTTNASGVYLFDIGTNNSSDSFFLQFGLLAGFQFSPADQGGDDALDSDVIDASTGLTATIQGFTLPSGSPLLTVDVGMFQRTVAEPGTAALMVAALVALLGTTRRLLRARAKR